MTVEIDVVAGTVNFNVSVHIATVDMLMESFRIEYNVTLNNITSSFPFV
jgi:hypothetical protein